MFQKTKCKFKIRFLLHKLIFNLFFSLAFIGILSKTLVKFDYPAKFANLNMREKMTKNFYRLLFVAGIGTSLLASCTRKEKNMDAVVVHQLSDPDMLNPINGTDAAGKALMRNIFQPLMDVDYKTLELVPILAESKPEVVKTPEGGLLITYKIKSDARWDNGKPVTAKDVEFTYKVIKNPKVNDMPVKPYFDFIKDIKLYNEDPLKFTIVADQVYIRAEYTSGAEVPIIPEYAYDPKGLLKKFKLSDFSDTTSKAATDPDVLAFADQFNSEKYQREKGFVVGSGAYEMVEWKTGQNITLKKKENWWGDKLKSQNMFFEANAPKIIYQTINDQTTALVALKAKNIDAMYGIKAKDFVDLPKSEKFTEYFNGIAAPFLAYSYIGINTRKPQFSSKKTRQALAHVLDVDNIIKTIQYGYGERITGPISPTKKADYDATLVAYDFNLEKAKLMLKEDGWADSDGDGILDKEVNGDVVSFKVDFSVNAGNDERKSAALMMKEEARKLGIEINVVAQEWSIYLDNLKQHKFDMYYGSWVGEYAPEDHSQIFATESANSGSNYTYFGNSETDKMIGEIKIEMDQATRSEMYKKFQRLLYEDCSYLFIMTPKNKIAISKRFDNAYESGMYPGFWPAGFIIK